MEAKLIEKDFNPNTIADGLYVTAAASPAFPTLTAMKVGGDAKIAGMYFDENGDEIVGFKIGKPGREVASNPRMEISQRWLQNAILDYSDWKEKFWRECVQNSADARAKNILLSAVKNDDGTFIISCEDDGTGMTLDVLLNKFLVLGGTTKEGGAETSGGFGKAKEMIILPWIGWAIHTKNSAAVGAGDAYTVYTVENGKWQWHQLEGETSPEFPPPGRPPEDRKGTYLAVLMPSEKHTNVAEAMAYVEKCWLPKIKFHFYGNAPQIDSSAVQGDLRNGRLIREIGDKAKIYYTKSSTRISRCLIRTREGLYMFNEYLPYDVSGYVVVELLKPSVEIITSNRDGISDSQVRQALREFLNNLAANTKSALNSQKYKITKVYKGEKFTAQDQRIAESEMVLSIGEMMRVKIGKEDRYEISDQAARAISDQVDHAEQQASRSPGEVVLTTNKEAAAVMAEQDFRSRDACEVLAKQLVWKPAFILHNDIDEFKIPSKFKPEGMTPATLRLIKVWTEFCRFVLTQLGSKLEWGVGFIFSDDARAALYTYDSVQWLVLNPFKSNNQDIYNPSNEADRNLLYSMAIHECTHLHNDAPDHNETFSTFITINFALCTGGVKKIKRIVESVPLRNQSEFGPKVDKSKYSEEDDALLAELRDTSAAQVLDLKGENVYVNQIIQPGFGLVVERGRDGWTVAWMSRGNVDYYSLADFIEEKGVKYLGVRIRFSITNNSDLVSLRIASHVPTGPADLTKMTMIEHVIDTDLSEPVALFFQMLHPGIINADPRYDISFGEKSYFEGRLSKEDIAILAEPKKKSVLVKL